jgi:uncharacterized protein (DUF983 family)
MVVWLPLTLLLGLTLLPFVKGAVMAVIWYTKRHSSDTNEPPLH